MLGQRLSTLWGNFKSSGSLEKGLWTSKGLSSSMVNMRMVHLPGAEGLDVDASRRSAYWAEWEDVLAQWGGEVYGKELGVGGGLGSDHSRRRRASGWPWRRGAVRRGWSEAQATQHCRTSRVTFSSQRLTHATCLFMSLHKRLMVSNYYYNWRCLKYRVRLFSLCPQPSQMTDSEVETWKHWVAIKMEKGVFLIFPVKDIQLAALLRNFKGQKIFINFQFYRERRSFPWPLVYVYLQMIIAGFSSMEICSLP